MVQHASQVSGLETVEVKAGAVGILRAAPTDFSACQGVSPVSLTYA
jgi:hypothetical protein